MFSWVDTGEFVGELLDSLASLLSKKGFLFSILDHLTGKSFFYAHFRLTAN